MIPNSISILYYTNRTLYYIVMGVVVGLLWTESQLLNNDWLAAAGFAFAGVRIFEAYKDRLQFAKMHYAFALIGFGLLVWQTSLETLLIPLALTLPAFLLRKKYNIFLLVFELSLFATTHYELWNQIQ